MSKIALTPNASGTGTLTIAAPNTSTDRTITLPDETGTVLTSGGAIDVNASAPADSVVINSSGNVGIGTTVTTGKLNVSKSGGNSINLIDSSGSSPGIRFANSSNTALSFIEAPAGNGLSFFSGSTERMRIDSSGDARIAMDNFAAAVGSSNGGVSLRRVSDGGYFEICRTSTASRNQVIFYNGNGAVGSISTNGSSTAYNTSSDYRLKENVVEVTDGIDRVKLLKPSRFNFIVDPDKTVDGFLAHEVADVVPEAITGTKDAVDADGNPEYQGIDQSKLVPLLTAALQEAITKIESLETEMITVKSRLDALESA